MFCSLSEILRATRRFNELFAAPRHRLSTNIKLELGLQLILTSLHEVAAASDRRAVVLLLVDRLDGPRIPVDVVPELLN